MKTLFLCLCLFANLNLSIGATVPAEPSSEIPDRREFPLSTKYKPCDDFHKYVCDDVEKSFKLRDDRNRHAFAFNDSSERLLKAKKDFFLSIDGEKNLSSRSAQIKDYYNACMNSSAGESQEKIYIQKTTSDINQIKNIEQLKLFLTQRIFDSEYSFISFGSTPNQNDPRKADAEVSVQLMNLPQYSYYENPELMSSYKNLLLKFFKIIHPELGEKDLQQKVDRLVEFEKEFVKIYPHPEVQRQRWSEKRQESQKDFINKYSQLAFADLLKKIPRKTLIFNPFPESIDFLNQKMTAENLEILKDLYLYRSLNSFMDDSQPDFFNQKFIFNNTYLGGPKSRPDRQERCTRAVMDTFPKELDQLLISKLFPNFPEKKFLAVAEKIRASIISGLMQNQWLEKETQKKAILKIQKAKLYLVQPRNSKEWDFLPTQKFSDKNRIDNSRKFSQNVFKKTLQEFETGLNLEAWAVGPLIVNAYYDPSANKFVMPIGILQYPFFNPSGDLIENIGAVGAVIGHELGHAIDDEGSKYDEKGQLNQWMTATDLKEFSNRGKKLITLFDKAGHNGALTLGENIGDLVGLTFAYKAAFQNTKPTIEEQKKLFISYARLWCYVARPKTEEQQLKTNPHALGWARINEQVKHQKKFAEAFSCQKGDPMTLPESEQVQIW